VTIDRNAALIDLVESDEAAVGRLPYEALTPAERVFVDVWGLEAEVNNGGFGQYFVNSDGDHAGTVVAALVAIGATKAAEIVQRAVVAAFGAAGPTLDRTARRESIRTLPEGTFENLDRAFYRYPDDLTALLYEFLISHRDAVRGAGRL
jgi:hypothetical protein